MDICIRRKSLKAQVQKHLTLSEKELQLFSAVFKEVFVAKGQFLLPPGTTIRQEYFVVKG
jgi:CRP/FNR family transcriptional regulator